MPEETAPDQPQTPLYEWVFHPAKANRTVTVLVTLFLFLLLVVVDWLAQSRLFTIIAAFLLLGSLRSFYFPTTYRLYADRIQVAYTLSSLTKEWKLYRSVYPERNGVFLSPFARPTRIENFRGLFLKYGDGERDRILEIVKAKVAAHVDTRTDVSAPSEGAAER